MILFDLILFKTTADTEKHRATPCLAAFAVVKGFLGNHFFLSGGFFLGLPFFL